MGVIQITKKDYLLAAKGLITHLGSSNAINFTATFEELCVESLSSPEALLENLFSKVKCSNDTLLIQYSNGKFEPLSKEDAGIDSISKTVLSTVRDISLLGTLKKLRFLMYNVEEEFEIKVLLKLTEALEFDIIYSSKEYEKEEWC